MKPVGLLIVVAFLLVMVLRIEANEIGFIEDFSLARDRAKAIAQLIPGSSDYYYYSCLHAQQIGDFEQTRALLAKWIEQEGYTDQVNEIRNRQALLEYRQRPQEALDQIQKTLHLRFDHRREVSRQTGELPTELDSQQISIARLSEHALSRYKNLDGFETEGLYLLNPLELRPEHGRALLKRLDLPDLPNLADLVVAELQQKGSKGFGAFPIHEKMTRTQLDRCRKLMPELADTPRFVHTYLRRLAPPAGIDIGQDEKEKHAYLNRLWAFVQPLSPVHNSLKVHVLYHLLDFNRHQGRYDPDLFEQYLKLPRQADYIRRDYLKKHRHTVAALEKDFARQTRLAPVGADEPLVRDYLSRLFIPAPDYRPYTPYIRESYLKRLFARTKIENGIGDAETWYAMLDPGEYPDLKARVDIRFAPENQRYFEADEPVSLELDIKNVQTLIIKVYEINSFNYYQAHGKPVDTAINLDGLVPAEERVVRYQAPPFRRIRRSFDFPELNRPGVWVVEFIGNGKSSRAVIRKGTLYAVEEISAAGHAFRIFDGANQHRREASLWMRGREYQPDENGVITVPFTSQPVSQPIILSLGEFCALDRFDHQKEQYQLRVRFYPAREHLLGGNKGEVLVRPLLTVNSQPVSLDLLEEVRLEISTQDHQGISATRTFSDFQLFEDRESRFEFPVPQGLSRIRFTLHAKVQNISANKKQDLSDSMAFPLNQIDQSRSTADLFLGRGAEGFFLEMRGKNGEPIGGRPVQLRLKHRFFTDPVELGLQTDANGRIRLGLLAGIKKLSAQGPHGIQAAWNPEDYELSPGQYSFPRVLHISAQEALTLPYGGRADPGPPDLGLFELRGEQIVSDQREAIHRKPDSLEISGLLPGDYLLVIRPLNQRIRLRVAEAKAHNALLLAPHQVLERSETAPFFIQDIQLDPDSLRIRTKNAGPFCRVHLLATCFVPENPPFQRLAHERLPGPLALHTVRPGSDYLGERNIGDEYRYILERQYKTQYPGNMLQRPELLLNPWDIRKTRTSVDQAGAGDPVQSAAPAPAKRKQEAAYQQAKPPTRPAGWSNYDFLKSPATLLANLRPDENGVIVLSRKQLGDHFQITVLALDPRHTHSRRISLPPGPIPRRDLREGSPPDPKRHLTRQRRISFVAGGARFSIPNAANADFEVYDSLEKVYELMKALNNDPHLQEFDFLIQWPGLSPEQKREKYSQYACHELNFFIHQKDRPFFERVIAGYLENKADKTFMDHWLLDADLSGYLSPWAFSRLNIVEQILLARKGWDPEGILAHITERFHLIPPAIEEYNRRFDTALRRKALEADPLDASESFDLSEEPMADRAAAPLDVMESEKMELVLPSMEETAAAGSRQAEKSVAARSRRFKRARQDLRQQIRPLFRRTDKTREWAENNYYRLAMAAQNAKRIPIHAFWQDYAQADPQQPFYSGNFILATANFTEMALALAVLDLPFEAGDHERRYQTGDLHLKAKTPLLIFHKSLKPAQPADAALPILIKQSFFDPDDPYRFQGNEQYDKFIQEEFLAGKAYGCRLVVGNPGSAPQKLNLLIRIPQGAMPLDAGFYTRELSLRLKPYTTRRLEYFFYFPRAGQYGLYPAQVSQNERFVAAAEPFDFQVVERLSRTDTGSWAYISQHGTDAEVLDYLKAHNLHRLDLNKIAFRMKDRPFFEKTIRLLSQRHHYQDLLWSYGIHHNLPTVISQYLQHSPYAEQCGDYLKTELLTLDPVRRNSYEHLEYKPLVNARAHRLGGTHKILNHRFYAQYMRFLRVLRYKPQLADADRLELIYYLLLQDRVAEALAWFETVEPKQLSSRLQYDYLQAYLCFYTQKLEQAEQIIQSHLDHPVDHWQKRFQAMADMTAEIRGKPAVGPDKPVPQADTDHLAATEPSFDFSVEARTIRLDYQNIAAIQVRYYPMDLELLFSQNPFVRGKGERFSLIRPKASQRWELPAEQSRFEFPLPDAFATANLVIELESEGIRKRQTYYAHDLSVQISENYGQIQVSQQQSGTALPRTYIKVYARMKDQQVRFYKDGYTDLRGRFDYVSLSTDAPEQVARYAILILHPEHGGLIREVDPPKQ